MELKVYVEGIQRVVCGVTETTTCQDVVYALAHATAQSGRFTLVERWRNNERFLAPFENPLTVLMKWGEYSSDVQFILRRSNTDGKINQGPINNIKTTHGIRPNGVQGSSHDHNNISNKSNSDITKNSNQPKSISEYHDSPEVLKRNRDIRKSFTFSGLHGSHTDNNTEVQMENIAVVQPTLQSKIKENHTQKSALKNTDLQSKGLADNKGFTNVQHKKNREVPPYREPPGLDSVPMRTLPPYRDPPPPIVTNSNRLHYQESPVSTNFALSKDDQCSNTNFTKSKRNQNQEVQDITKKFTQLNKPSVSQQLPQNVPPGYSQRYAELIRLVNKQRDTINSQQADLTKLDAEILYWESKNKEHSNQMDFISQEINRIESTGRIIEEQLSELIHTEEESELVRQQEKTLKSEITLLRSKLANCETELLQCKNKIRLLMEELSLEQHNMNRKSEERSLIERKVSNEIERLQNEIEQTKRLTDHINLSSEALKQEVTNLESIIVDKKMQVERLVSAMKEANLQSLTVACQDEQIKYLLEGAQKPGSTRKMIGSPRQLENAVPTSKNPHGVWV